MSLAGAKGKKKTIAVIGAGIVGISAAIWLQRDGHNVVIIDKQGPAAGASYGNGGVLAACAIIPVNAPGLIKSAPAMLLRPDSPLFLRWSYLPKLIPWLLKYLSRANAGDTRHVAKALTQILHDSLEQHQALARGTGAEEWLKPSDYLFVYRNRTEFEKEEFAWAVRHEMGFKWQELDEEALNNYDPIFKGTRKFAVRLKGHGIISDPGKYVEALARHFEQQGGKIVIAKADDIVRHRGVVVGVKISKGQSAKDQIDCDSVILAAGVWSKKLSEKLGAQTPLEAERGYHIELINPSAMPRSALMLASGKFVITPMEGRIRCAGIVEFGGLEAPASKRPVELLKKQVREAMPGLTWERVEEWMGHRPATTDSIPFIGPYKNVEGAYAAFGHHHIGLTGGPKTGRMIADMVANKKINIDVDPYAVSRFTH